MWMAKNYNFFFIFFIKVREESAPVAHLYHPSMQQLQRLEADSEVGGTNSIYSCI